MSATAVANRPASSASSAAALDASTLDLLERWGEVAGPAGRTVPALPGRDAGFEDSRARPGGSRLRPRHPVRRLRPGTRSGRGVSPVARSAPGSAGSATPTLRLPVRGCTVDVATAAPTVAGAHTRLTDRGIAVILVAGVMLVIAAVTVVGLTALRVTGDSAEPLPPAQVVQPFSAQG